MRACIVSTSFPIYEGHVQSPFLLSLAKELRKKVYLSVLCPYTLGSAHESVVGGVDVHRFNYFWPKNLQTLTNKGGIPSNLKKSLFAKLQFLTLSAAMFFSILRHVRKEKVDLIHAQWSLTGFLSVLVKKLTGVPVVVTERGAALNLAAKNGLMRRVLVYTLKNCDAVTSNNEKQAAIIKGLGIDSKRVSVVVNGVEQGIFKQMDKKKCKESLRLDTGSPLLLFVGWLIERKGLNYLLQALKDLLNDHPNAILVVVGEGALERNLKKEASDLGIAENVVFAGSKTHNEVAEYMNAADIFVLPSISEGRANVIAEALSCGTPVVATDVGDAASLVEDGVSGYLCRPEDSKDIYSKIRLALKPEFKRKFEKNIQNFRDERLISWKECADRYLKIYDKVVVR